MDRGSPADPQPRVHDGFPRWSPNGLEIMFTSLRDGTFEVYVMSVFGGNERRLTVNPERRHWRRLVARRVEDRVLVAARWQHGGLRDGRDRDEPGAPHQPRAEDGGRLAWSPDGSRIAFSSFRDDNDEIYVMNADGTNLRRMTNHPAKDRYPAWSPDGQRLAFSSHRDGNDEIYVMNADGTGSRA